MAAVVAGIAILALVGVGVGLGALLRSQVATVAEPILAGIPAQNDWTSYLPGSASAALTHVSLTTQDYLQP